MRTSILSIAAIVAASTLALHAPLAAAADKAAADKAGQTAETKRGVPGVDVDVGKNASDRGLPGVEMNVGKDGDQKNLDGTNKLGAGADTKADVQKTAPARKDKN